MGGTFARLESVFNEALSRLDPSERAAYLDRECLGDSDFRRRVEALLSSHASPDKFLDLPSGDALRNAGEPLHEHPGTKIGRYKLIKQIGEGGFGVVFQAEQEEPIRRQVALKIIKLGMDTKQVLARFDAERQALAMMNHPNIADALDGGATETGRPYFVMELVTGESITTYCNEHKLTTKERLLLFSQICAAVQHAHQKGIIHRDLKPSNILVTVQDGKPIPKIIDFGVAKATQARLTEKTLFTDFRHMIGTPTYMSPEQAEMSGLDIDTRSDIYSLGVLLYEMLTGSTPFDSQTLRSAAYDEMRRIIREVDPPSPSSRLSTFEHEALRVIAEQRCCDPKGLGQQIKGDLDWIVMKALEKERSRRYESASAFRDDIERHLLDEPVQARPTNTMYRLRKFARRHRAIVAAIVLLSAATSIVVIKTTMAVAVLLSVTFLIAVIGTTFGLIRARAALAVAEQQRKIASLEATKAINAEKLATQRQEEAEQQTAKAKASRDFLMEILSSADPNRVGDRIVNISDLLDAASKQISERFKGHPELEFDASNTLADTYDGLGLREKATDQYRKSYLLAHQLSASASDIAILKVTVPLVRGLCNLTLFGEGKRSHLVEAKTIATGGLQVAARLYGLEDPRTLLSEALLASVLAAKKELPGARAIFDRVLSYFNENPERVTLTQRSEILSAAISLAYDGEKDLARSERLVREAYALGDLEERHGWHLLSNLAAILLAQEKYAEARDVWKQALTYMRGKLGDNHPETVDELYWYALTLLHCGDFDELVIVLKDWAKLLAATNEETIERSSVLWALSDAYSLVNDDRHVEETSAEAFAMMQRVNVPPNLVLQRQRAAILRTMLGSEYRWANQSLRANVWCLLDEMLSELGFSDLESVHNPLTLLTFNLERSAFPEDGRQSVASGTMNDLRELGDLEEGIYLLTLNTEAHTTPCFHCARWVTLLHWQAHKYAHCRIFDHEAEWRTFSSLPVQVPRHEFGTLAMAPLLTRFTGAGGALGLFGMIATTTLKIPAGIYRVMVTATGCIRVDLDNQRLLNSWTPGPIQNETAVFESDGSSRSLRVEYFHVKGEYKLWLRIEPLNASLGGKNSPASDHIEPPN